MYIQTIFSYFSKYNFKKFRILQKYIVKNLLWKAVRHVLCVQHVKNIFWAEACWEKRKTRKGAYVSKYNGV